MQFEFHAWEKCYTKLFSNNLPADVAQTTTMAVLLHKTACSSNYNYDTCVKSNFLVTTYLLIQLKLHQKQVCYVKFLYKHLGTGVAQTIRMAELLQKWLHNNFSADAAQTADMAKMLHKNAQ